MPVAHATLQVQQQSAADTTGAQSASIVLGTNTALHASQAEVSRIQLHLQSANGAPEDMEMDSDICTRLQHELNT